MPLAVVVRPDRSADRINTAVSRPGLRRRLHAENPVRVELPGTDLAAFVNADGHRDGSEPNVVGSCLLMVLGDAEPGVYGGPVIVVGWDRTRPQLDVGDGDEWLVQSLTPERALSLWMLARRVASALDGFDTGAEYVGHGDDDTRAWDQAVREHGRRVRDAFVPR